MLVMDAFHGHMTKPVKKRVGDLNGDLAIIPGVLPKELQVLDVAVNKSFKDNLRQSYIF